MPPTQRQGKEPVAQVSLKVGWLVIAKIVAVGTLCSLLSSDNNPGVMDLNITRDYNRTFISLVWELLIRFL